MVGTIFIRLYYQKKRQEAYHRASSQGGAGFEDMYVSMTWEKVRAIHRVYALFCSQSTLLLH